MTSARDVDRELGRWLETQALVTPPAGLHAATMGMAGASRQRPRWLVGLSGDAFPARDRLAGRSSRTVILVIVALALIVAAVAVAGAFRSAPIPVGANGVIAYSIFENKQRSGQTSFAYLVHADGSGNERLATGTCPTFSANGAVMAYRSHWAGEELVVADGDGSSPRELPITVDPQYRDDGYALSPDGTRVAWVKRVRDRNELWVTPLAGGADLQIVPVSVMPAETFGMLLWSPDGTTIAFEGHVSRPQAEGRSYRRAVYLVGAAGGQVRRLTARQLGSSAGLSWSPDGRSIAYLGLPDGVALPSGPDDGSVGEPAEVFVIGVDGTGDRQVTRTPAFESRPRWSPDGTRLAYLSAEDAETFGLAVISMDGAVPTGPSVLGPRSEGFSWSPDGTTLLFIDTTTIRSVDAALERPPTLIVDVGSLPVDPRYPHANSTDYEHCPPSWQWLRP